MNGSIALQFNCIHKCLSIAFVLVHCMFVCELWQCISTIVFTEALYEKKQSIVTDDTGVAKIQAQAEKVESTFAEKDAEYEAIVKKSEGEVIWWQSTIKNVIWQVHITYILLYDRKFSHLKIFAVCDSIFYMNISQLLFLWLEVIAKISLLSNLPTCAWSRTWGEQWDGRVRKAKYYYATFTMYLKMDVLAVCQV